MCTKFSEYSLSILWSAVSVVTFHVIPDIGNLCLLSFYLSLSLFFFFLHFSTLLRDLKFCQLFSKDLLVVSLIFSAHFFFFPFNITDFESSVQFSHSVVSDSLQPQEPQHTRPPFPSPTPRVYPNSCPLSR